MCKDFHNCEDINFGRLYSDLIHVFNEISLPSQGNFIRIYYYDALVDKDNPNYDADKAYFDSIEENYPITVRLGKVVGSSTKKRRQKGVDVSMVIDAITKAYELADFQQDAFWNSVVFNH
jgi:hypothetical protein